MRSPDGKSVEMMNRQKMEVGLRCVQETKRRGDREWKMAEGYKMQDETEGAYVVIMCG